MISSITVTYNPDIECLRQQLLSVRKQVELCVIVDNGSNNIIEIKNLNHEFDFHLIQFNENYGLAYFPPVRFPGNAVPNIIYCC